MANVQHLRDILYQLKQDYGFAATLIKVSHEQTDSVTGQRSVTRSVVRIPKVVDLPSDTTRKFWYDMAFMKANTNFTYGAEQDVKSKQIIIDKRDLRRQEIKETDYISIRHERFSIKKVYDLEHGLGYLLDLQLAIGALPFDVIFQTASSRLQLAGEAVNSA
jgi:hypothetical protein